MVAAGLAGQERSGTRADKQAMGQDQPVAGLQGGHRLSRRRRPDAVPRGSGFHLAGYGCMTCIGASGPLIPEVTDAVHEHDLGVVSVLSGNRNFDGRINPDVRMNYLASPPLVVAYALAGTMDIDLVADRWASTPTAHRSTWPTSGPLTRDPGHHRRHCRRLDVHYAPTPRSSTVTNAGRAWTPR